MPKVRRAYTFRAYDGYGVGVYEQSLSRVVLSAIGEWLVDNVDFCCNPKLQKLIFWERPGSDNEGVFGFWWLNFFNRFEGQRENEFSYPLIDEWVIEHRPDAIVDWEHEEKDPNWGTICPSCNWGRVNSYNTESIEKYNKCLHCRIREGAYDGRP